MLSGRMRAARVLEVQMSQLSGFLEQWSQWVFLAAVLVCVLIINRIVHAVIGMIVKRMHPEKRVWSHAFVAALDAPLRAFVWLFGAAFAVQHFFPLAHNARLATTMPPAFHVLITLIIAWYLLRVINRAKDDHLVRAERHEHDIDTTAVDAIAKLSWVLVLIFAAMTILQTLHIPLSGLLAFGGAAGIAVGFAARSLVANLLGGLTVFVSRIFKLGEAIIMPGTDLAGEVEKIGWRSTRVRGWDGKPFYIPNAVFNTETIINHSRMSHRTISENVLLRYHDFDKVEAIVREGNDYLENREDIGYYVFRFARFGDSSLQLAIYAYALTDAYAEYMRIKEEVLLAMASIAKSKGCDLILPLNYYQREDGLEPPPASNQAVAADTAAR
jgi:MscS family membrane protein